MIRLGIMTIFAVSAHCFLTPRKLEGKRELVKVNFLDDHLQGNRFARSTDERETFPFPEVLIFNVTMEDDVVVTLTLHLSHANRANPPIFVYNEDGQLVRKDSEDSGRHALYQDYNSKASYLVACNGPEPEQCSLHGSFFRGAKKYHMSAHADFDNNGMHEIIHVGEVTRNFTGDAMVTPDDIANENRNDGSAGPSARPKRALPDANIVELLAMPDDSVYEAFLELEQGSITNAEEAMRLYYALIANEIDLSYLSVPMVNPSLNIRVSLAGVIIAKNENEAGWSRDNTEVREGTTYLNANGALTSFTNWRNTRRNDYTAHDHAMAFTMKDFEYVSGGSISDGVAGQAWLGQVCKSSDTSVVEDDGTRVAYISAHELGHSLNSDHDGEENTCNNEDYNVMTTILFLTTGAANAEAQWTFSSCSVDQFNNYINSLGNNHCMTKHESIAADSLDDPVQLPGQYYSLDQQCQFGSGRTSTSCTSSPVPESSCHFGVSCNPSCNKRLYVMAGTPCGAANENKWCYKGICTEKPTNPSTTTTTEKPATTTTTEKPATTTTTEKPATTTTTEKPATTTTERPGITTTTRVTTTTTLGPVNYCTETCCKQKKNKLKCCVGENCCRKKWSKGLPCCTDCDPTATTTKPETTTTTEKPATTTTTEKPATTTTTEKPATTTTTEKPATTTTTEKPATTTTTRPEVTTTTAGPLNYCTETCCKQKTNKVKCCDGNKCCRKNWSKGLPCCTQCIG